MMKRIIVGGAFAVVILGLLLIYFFSKTKSFESAVASKAVSSNCILFADHLDYNYFTEEFRFENLVWEELTSNSEIFRTYDSLLHRFSNMVDSRPLLKEALSDGSFSISVHLMGKSKLSTVLYLNPDEALSMNDVEAAVISLFGKEAIINDRKYEAVNLKDISIRNEGKPASFCMGIKDGLFIASTSSILVEDAIRNLNSKGGIHFEKGFQKVEATAGRYVHANIYVNYRVLDGLFYPAVESGQRSILKVLAGMADWGEVDAELNDEAWIFNGMAFSEDSLAQYLNLFNEQPSVRLDAAAYIPSNTTRFLWSGIGDVEKFKRELENHFTKSGVIQEFRSADQKLKSKMGVSPLYDMLDIMDDELFWLRMDGSGTDKEYELTGWEVKSHSEAVTRLTSWTLNYAAEKEMDHSRLVSDYKLDEQTTYDIFHLPELMYHGFFPEHFLGSYFAVYDNYVFFSDSKEAISRAIYQNVLHKTLENEFFFGEVSNYLSSKGNLAVFLRPDRFMESLSGILGKGGKALFKSVESSLKKVPGLVIQYVNEGEMFYSNVTLKYAAQVKEKSLTEWESLLDSVAIIKPSLVINHNTSDKEIFVQDATHSIYLINSTGRILWNLKLEEVILSEVYQIDYYKNGKLQYLFSTGSGIHLIDRNGNYVERYPIKFRSDATNGIALFDYDNRKEYRLFVACSDRKVYVYDIEGNIIPGWDFTGSEGVIRKPIQHFRLKEKDYIVFSDPIRAYILDRRGKERVRQKSIVAVSEQNQFFLDMNLSGGVPRLITTDTSGNVIGFDFEGNVERILDHNATSDHYFRIKDINNDGSVEYIFADKNELKVIDPEGKRFFSYKIKSDIELLPDIYQFSASDQKIGITDIDENEIYLINSDGSLYEGFPIEGCTRYSIGYFSGSDSRFNLIVGSNNGFIYNYSIE